MVYNSSLIDKHASENVRAILENVRLSFTKFLVTADWLDEDAKSDYLEKSKKMRALIGFPDWDKIGEGLDFYYTTVIFFLIQIISVWLNGLFFWADSDVKRDVLRK